MVKILKPFLRFIQTEINAGVLLLVVTLLAVVIANSPWGEFYFQLFEETHLKIQFQFWSLDKPLYYWINDGLMAIFFLLIGLEVKREILIGELSSIKKAMLPLVAAIGGMLFPAVIFVLFTWNDPTHIQGWAIPMATDIAFALGILAMLSKRVPIELKLFLASLAIVDDIGAVLTIAIFFTETIVFSYLAIAAGFLILLFLLNRLGVNALWVYITIGIFCIWFPLLKSGVHPTIAGILVAFTIPLRRKFDNQSFRENMNSLLAVFREKKGSGNNKLLSNGEYEQVDLMYDQLKKVSSPLQRLENMLHGFTLYWIMPIFAFANAGIMFGGLEWGEMATSGLSNGIFWGLVIGKVTGIVTLSWICLKLKWAVLPESLNFRHLLGAGFLAGIGFTMSIFITELAFHSDTFIIWSKTSILIASIVSGLIGYAILRWYAAKT